MRSLQHVLYRAYAASPQRPRNENIEYNTAKVAVDGKLEGPFMMRDILARREQKPNGGYVTAVELVATTPTVIVKYVNIRDEYLKMKAQKKKDAEAAKTRRVTEVQMTWQTSDADLSHKLDKVREALQKGAKAHISYTSKKRTARLTMDQMKEKMQKTVELLEDVGKEYKPQAIFPHGTAIIHLEPLSK